MGKRPLPFWLLIALLCMLAIRLASGQQCAGVSRAGDFVLIQFTNSPKGREVEASNDGTNWQRVGLLAPVTREQIQSFGENHQSAPFRFYRIKQNTK